MKKLVEYNEQEHKVIASLYDVIDPELYINIVDMGLIYTVKVDDEKNIFITMTLSTQYCPMRESIVGGVQNVLQIEFPEHEIHINMTFDPPWSFERLTPEGLRMLQMM